MLNFKKEPALSASEIAHRIRERDGIEIHDDTVRDWMTRGVKGVLLESRAIGNRLFSTWEAYLRFDRKQNKLKLKT